MGNKPAIVLKTGWWNYVLTMFIVFVRAFRPGAESIEEWSAISWFFMLTPVLFPLYAYLAYWTVFACGTGLTLVLRELKRIAGKTFNRRV